MTGEMLTLLAMVASVAFLHSLLGPVHFLPFAPLSPALGVPMSQTAALPPRRAGCSPAGTVDWSLFWSRWRPRLWRRRHAGQGDDGSRTGTGGGRQRGGFSALVRALLVESGSPGEFFFDTGRDNGTLPGFFRPTKQWDVVVVVEGHLLAAIEFKALCGPSFGNNYNNPTC